MQGLRYLFVLLGIILATNYNAQVKGKVVEISKKSDTTIVPGVVVIWEGSAIGSTTDENGNFTLPIFSETNRLIISSVGYENKTITVMDTSKFLLLVLKSGIDLNEVEILYYTNGTEVSYLNPIKMEMLNERSLMKAACCNLSESFETNPSIDVNFADAISGAKQIQMLGLSGQYAQITKENMPYLRGLANNYGLSFIPGTWIQSIQLSKGAGSVVNGYESLTGQINTELQNPESSDKLNFNVYANENARNEYNLNLSHRFNPKLSFGLLSHMSYNPLVQDLNKDGFADIPTGKQYNFMNKYAFNNGKNFEAQVGAAYVKDERAGGQYAGTVKNYNDTVPLYKIGIDNEKWEVYSKTGFVFKKKPGTSMGLQLSYLDHNQTNFYGNNKYNGLEKTFYANYIFQGILGTTNNTYKIGASFMNDEVKESFNLYKFKRLEQVTGVFAEYAKNYKEKFNIVAGIRVDQHNYYGLFVIPRLHLRYAFKPTSVLRFSGGRALRTANIFTDNSYLMASSRQWYVETSDLAKPYGLNPETAWNYGLNYTQKFKINYRDAYVTLDLYRTDFVNQVVTDIDYNTQEVHIFNLKGPSYSNTFQFEFNMEPRKRLFVKMAYRFVDTKMSFKEGLMQKAMVSKHRAFINIGYETKNSHWLFDFTTQYNGAKRLPGTETNPDEYQRAAYSPDYFNLLGQITYVTKIKKADFNIYLGVENLLNYKQTNPIVSGDMPYSKYFDASMVWGSIYGRMLYMGLRFKIK
ncbi:TonB-dependent receptor [Aurantibacillus circumpalustris]|uniref:TonB-dependent receptor n=1 Tax=Aurantibacillus circumpalustris TaxID=3036359 RepID=UPI00295B0A1E|nr:carboxypeptidase-like regulatory domain-containing protein [Aurantibacillus circumpalustris]